ncbi:MAG: D-ribose pyranase, partial [Serratia liquefaciens]
MKKGVLLNADVSAVVSRLGHTDQIASLIAAGDDIVFINYVITN